MGHERNAGHRLPYVPNHQCRKPLFHGHPIALTTADVDMHVTRNDIPLVVDFWAPWRSPCRMMAPAYEQAAKLLEPYLHWLGVCPSNPSWRGKGDADRYEAAGGKNCRRIRWNTLRIVSGRERRRCLQIVCRSRWHDTDRLLGNHRGGAGAGVPLRHSKYSDHDVVLRRA